MKTKDTQKGLSYYLIILGVVALIVKFILVL